MTDLRTIGAILGSMMLGGVVSLMAQPESWFVRREQVELTGRLHWFGTDAAKRLGDHADALNESIFETSGLRRQVIALFAGTRVARSGAHEFATGPVDDGLIETAKRIDQVFRHGHLMVHRATAVLWCAPMLLALGTAMVGDALVRRRIRIATCQVPSPLMQQVGRILLRSGTLLMIVLWAWPGVVPALGVPIAALMALTGLVSIINHLPRNV